MDKAKILRLCDEIEYIATEIKERTMKNSYFMAQTIINKVLVIAAEISSPPKSNADRIRHLTDEELADVLQGQCACCAYQLTGCTEKECKDGAHEWLKQEVSEDATERTD